MSEQQFDNKEQGHLSGADKWTAGVNRSFSLVPRRGRRPYPWSYIQTLKPETVNETLSSLRIVRPRQNKHGQRFRVPSQPHEPRQKHHRTSAPTPRFLLGRIIEIHELVAAVELSYCFCRARTPQACLASSLGLDIAWPGDSLRKWSVCLGTDVEVFAASLRCFWGCRC